MEVTALKTEGENLVVVGTIMGAMPTEAILTPTELRKAFKLLSFGKIMFLLKMLVAK
jgi:hypothetical protein